MRTRVWIAGTVAIAAASYALGAETRKSFVETYTAVADAILGAKNAEHAVVKSILEGHRDAAHAAFAAGKYDDAAAEMALFANEGDNQIGGVRKRLLEGGHHHNAEGEEKGVYEAGYVLVTKAAKKAALDAAAALQAAHDDAGRKAAWDDFAKTADPLIQ